MGGKEGHFEEMGKHFDSESRWLAKIFLCVVDKGGWGLLWKEIQFWAPGSVDKLYADFIVQDMKEITFGMESSKEQDVREYWLRVGRCSLPNCDRFVIYQK